MHIAYITDQILPQTATDTEQLVTMSAALGDEGAEVTLVTPSHWFKNDKQIGKIADYYNVNPSFKLKNFFGAVPFIRGVEKIVHAMIAAIKLKGQKDFDIIYTRNLPIIIAFLLFTSQKVVYENYRPWPDQNKFMIPLFKWFMKDKQMVGLILHSKLAAASYKKIGFSEEQILVAYNGVDIESFQTPTTKNEYRKELGWDQGSTFVTYTGRVNREKGLEIMLELASEFPQVNFVIVGSEEKGPIEQEAESLENVVVYPWQNIEDLPPFLLASDILFIPPTIKPLKQVGNTVLPMKTFLYLATGRVILGPQSPDLEEILIDGKNAILVPPDDFSTLKKRFMEIVNDEEYQIKIGRAAKNDSKQYNWEYRAKLIHSFLEERLTTEI